MQHEFDNTFESLLRRAAARRAGEVLPENEPHLDADELSAFAENALPEMTRARFAAHLADCSDCRQILINFASIQDAEENEVVETETVAKTPPTWSERFARWFALPNLGYAAAALTILFVGVFAFIALQSRQQQPTGQVAQIVEADEEKAEQKRRAARTQPVQPEPTVESTPEATPEAMSLAEMGNANSAENSNQESEQSPNRGLPPSYRVPQEQANGGESVARQKEQPETPRESNRATNTSNNAPGANANTLARQPSPTNSSTQPKAELNPAESAPKPASAPDVAKTSDEREEKLTTDTQALKSRTNPGRSTVAAGNSIAARSVGGKTFQKLDGVWRDQAYSSQAIVSVARGSDEYKKLDSGLRSIADSFRGEAVVIVWQGKAYRIR